ncbi:hypothetical protein [Helicobacter canadensis]|uniref:Glycosyl transferase n=1 Tax=Helicobacter canadensis MIT 98-5491 TaxID=537970 RepID=C5ZXN5_9HELI|nr:hypothetical protein [Helicobacter canadensis]EES89903.1 putative glycosyl transferase [Helicobacter canadensis MIT 98-5491]EFR49049.1 hypothetical protein HCMG_01222 [Helicobacter canadensis MIT 98-5491]STP02597.1 Uncharacterised protein [Helicobacter canadensis]
MNVLDSRLISVAILNRNIDFKKLQEFQDVLKAKFSYFEILLINPKFTTSAKEVENDDIIKNSPNLRILKTSNNIDKNLYYQIFLRNCIGDCIAFFDLEKNSFQDLLEMLGIANKYDIVIGVRKKKNQNLFQKIISYMFYQFIRLFYHYDVRQDYSDFYILNRKVIHYLLKEKTNIYLLRLIQFDTCFSKYEYYFIPIGVGEKVNFFDSVGLGIDIVIQNSYRTLRLATILSLCASFFNFLYFIYAMGSYFFNINVMGGWTSTSAYSSIINFCLFLVLAIFGEYLRIILMRTKHNNLHELVEEESNFQLYIEEKNIRNS